MDDQIRRDMEFVRVMYPDARLWEHYPGDWQIAVGPLVQAELLVIKADGPREAWKRATQIVMTKRERVRADEREDASH